MKKLIFILACFLALSVKAQETVTNLNDLKSQLNNDSTHYLKTTAENETKAGRLTLGELDLSTWTLNANPDSITTVNNGKMEVTIPATGTSLGWESVNDSSAKYDRDSIYFGTVVIKMLNDDSLCVFKNNVFKSRIDTLFY